MSLPLILGGLKAEGWLPLTTEYRWGAFQNEDPREDQNYNFLDYYHIFLKFSGVLWFLKIEYTCTLRAACEVWIASYLHRFLKKVFERPEFT